MLTMAQEAQFEEGLDVLANDIVNWRAAQGFDTNLENVPEKLALIHSEISEALEAHRALGEDHTEKMMDELADATIRILDLAYSIQPDGTTLATRILDIHHENYERPKRHKKRY